MKDKNPEWLTVGDDFADVTLASAMEVAGAKVAVIRMREPTVADQRAASRAKGGDAEQEVALLSNLCEVSPADIDRLKLRDYKRLQTALLGFID